MKLTKIAVMLAAAGLSASAFATNGYFSHGYGIKAKGMGGVGVALPQDSLAAATNPAGIVMVGDRLDVGVDLFMPKRNAEIAGNPGGLNGTWNGNGDKNFLIPDFGYNKMLGWDMAVGIAVYGNGGMNTRYKPTSPFATGPFAFMGGSGDAGVNLEQLFVAPTFAMKINKDHSLGVSLIYAQQRFGATGLQAFDNGAFSSSPGNVTDRGNDTTDGWGLRLGWTGRLSDNLTVGATYASKIEGKFDAYKGLFAESGQFDIPENYAIGVAYKATPKMTVAFDVERINYGDIPAISNKIDCLFAGTCQLGGSNGAGFGWRSMTAYKLGVSYDFSNDLTLRAGYNYGRQPIPSSQTFFNILAPGVVESHLTAGATWKLSNQSELSVSYMHAFSKSVNGNGSIPAGFGGGEANIKMKQDAIGISYGMKFQ
jgi:long-chain fatty acid transport protein